MNKYKKDIEYLTKMFDVSNHTILACAERYEGIVRDTPDGKVTVTHIEKSISELYRFRDGIGELLDLNKNDTIDFHEFFMIWYYFTSALHSIETCAKILFIIIDVNQDKVIQKQEFNDFVKKLNLVNWKTIDHDLDLKEWTLFCLDDRINIHNVFKLSSKRLKQRDQQKKKR